MINAPDNYSNNNEHAIWSTPFYVWGREAVHKCEGGPIALCLPAGPNVLHAYAYALPAGSLTCSCPAFVDWGFQGIQQLLVVDLTETFAAPILLLNRMAGRAAAKIMAQAGLRTPKGFTKVLSVQVGSGLDQHGACSQLTAAAALVSSSNSAL